MLIKVKGIGKIKEEYASRQHGIEVVACYRSGSSRLAVSEEQTGAGLSSCYYNSNRQSHFHHNLLHQNTAEQSKEGDCAGVSSYC